jgi:hypothetical protein
MKKSPPFKSPARAATDIVDPENNQIWTDSSASTLIIAKRSPAPSIQSYEHFKHGAGTNKVRKTQTEMNVNYFGANDDEIGVIKYKTPFSKGLKEQANSGSDSFTTGGSVYVLESASKKKNHDAVAPSSAAFSPYPKSSSTATEKNTPVVKIAIPRPLPLPKSPLRFEDRMVDDHDFTEGERKFPLVIDDTASITASSIQMATPSKEDMIEDEQQMNLLGGCENLAEQNSSEQKNFDSSILTKDAEDDALAKETRAVEKRLSSGQSDLSGSDRCYSPSELSQGEFVKSSVVVPAVKFLPPQPSSRSTSDAYVDFGPSRGNPASQTLSGISG